MTRMSADLVVIGGGVTGAGVARDAAMRGFRTILVERADIAQGTSGRFHGLLHSGARYVVADPRSAMECAEESAILRRIQAEAIEDTGGYFVQFAGDDPDYADRWVESARDIGLPFEEIDVAELLKREPRVNPSAQRAMHVADGSVDGWRLAWGAVDSARAYGAKVLSYLEVCGIEVTDGQASAVRCRDLRTDAEVVIDTGFVINAAGPWAGRIAALAGCGEVEVVPGRGIMLAVGHRLVHSTVNRLAVPGDGDLIVPAHTVSIIGTTDVRADDPDQLWIPRAEVQQMLDAGERLVPGFRQARIVHAWAGARPLVKDARASATDTRHLSRGMVILDHASRDGVRGLLTVIGGKLTTYRLMAKGLVDLMCEQLGDPRPCTTDTEPVPGSESGHTHQVSQRLRDRENDRLTEQLLCECELVTRRMFTDALHENPDASLDDLRRQLRLGMGSCQGGFCSTRAAAVACAEGERSAAEASDALRLFLSNRWLGLWPILQGDQLRQAVLDNWIISGTLDAEHLPLASSGSRR